MNRADYKPPASIEVARAMRRQAIMQLVCTGPTGLMGMLKRGEITVHGAAWAYDFVFALEMGHHGDGIGEGR